MDPDGNLIQGIIIGVNCCRVQGTIHSSSNLSTSLTASILQSNCKQRAVVLYPNSGEEWDAVNQDWWSEEGTGCVNSIDWTDEMMQCVRGIQYMPCVMRWGWHM